MTPKKPAARTGPADEKPAPSFEQALERLEAIVSEMEGGDVSLEKMIERFEEGRGLIAFCTRKLNEVERRIEILVRKGDELAAEPFEAPAGDEAAGGETGGGAGGKTGGELF